MAAMARPASRVGDLPGLAEYQRVLLVCGESERAGRIARGLQSANLIPVLSFTANQAARCLNTEMFHVLVVDALATTRSEWLLVLDAASQNAVPILSVGEFDAEFDDLFDYWVVGRAIEEIVAGAVRLTMLARPVRAPAVSWGELRLDVARRRALWRGEEINFTVTEFRIMEVLVLAASSIVAFETLARRVWRCESFDDRERLFAHIRRIRKKIEADPSRPAFLLTVRSIGFRLRCENEQPVAAEETYLTAISRPQESPPPASH